MMPRMTLFTCPKAFTDPHINLIQRNAIRSWLELGEGADIFLIGDEEGISAVAENYQVAHLPEVEKNEWGTPRVDSIFNLARKANANPLMAYLNADIILPPDFISVMEEIFHMKDRFLAVGQRWDLKIEEEISFERGWFTWLSQQVLERGGLHGPTAMDYFVFPRELFTDIPPFAIGRAGWDNWMVYQARQQGWMVVDVTPSLTVVHQNHDYAHLPGGKPHYKLEESRRNVELGGGFDKVYHLLDVDKQYSNGRIQEASFSLARFLRKLERWVRPEKKVGWRWKLTRHLRKMRRKVM